MTGITITIYLYFYIYLPGANLNAYNAIEVHQKRKCTNVCVCVSVCALWAYMCVRRSFFFCTAAGVFATAAAAAVHCQ